ncbi:MAG: hypothetical protein ACHQ7M_16165 [Chloroflexota bacterium]
MTARLDDQRVDALSFSAPDRPGLPLKIISDGGSHEEMLFRSALAFYTPSLLSYLAGGLLAREGIQVDEIGIRYPGDELDEGEEPFDGVKLISPMGEVLVSLDAFERFMARYLHAYITWLEEVKDPVIRQPEFDIVRETATALSQRAHKTLG